MIWNLQCIQFLNFFPLLGLSKALLFTVNLLKDPPLCLLFVGINNLNLDVQYIDEKQGGLSVLQEHLGLIPQGLQVAVCGITKILELVHITKCCESKMGFYFCWHLLPMWHLVQGICIMIHLPIFSCEDFLVEFESYMRSRVKFTLRKCTL